MGQSCGSTISITTFGCQMNKLDSDLLRGELRAHGFEFTEDRKAADVVLFNTCSVRQHAEDRVSSYLGALRRVVESRPHVIVGVIGCMAQRQGAEIMARFPHVRLVCGPGKFLNVPHFLGELRGGEERILALDNAEPIRFDRDVTVRPQAHHAYVSIMRGCNNFCAYCIVPYVRGREVSREPDAIVEEVQRLVDDGVVEVTLLGQNVNAYKSREPAADLADLLARLNEIVGLRRLRFVTSHPKDLSERILQAVASLDRVCEHLHVPAQAGSDRILACMGRGYTAGQYLEMVSRARELAPEIEFASDFIVGFPTETEADFQATLDLVERVRFQQCFMFKYSPRPGTRAATLPDDVPDEAKRDRLARLIALQRRIHEDRHAAMVGRRVEALIDGPSKSDAAKARGRTRQNDIVIVPMDGLSAGEFADVRITDYTDLSLFGTVMR